MTASATKPPPTTPTATTRLQQSQPTSAFRYPLHFFTSAFFLNRLHWKKQAPGAIFMNTLHERQTQ